ncbi:MAG TPA: cell division protein FtsQ/DivIB, partial [Methylotenera sp.]|nr:cell division protein FtsQ/DivIB [Methylotenera sp.]
HQELARWGSTALVNTHGELFYAATNSELPIFNGPADSVIEVASHYGEFSKTLNEANLKIAGLTLTPRRAWEVTTSSGMLIELGRVEMQNRIEKFANVYVSTIAGLNKKIVYADLRYPNGFAVRRPAADLKQMEEKIKEVNAIKKKPVAQVKPKPTEVSQQI